MTEQVPKRTRAPALESDISARKIVRVEVISCRGSPERLAYIFDVPNRLDALLKASLKPIATVVEAKLFLLENFKELSQIIQTHDRSLAIEALDEFLPLWLKQKEPINRLSIPDGCELASDSKFVRLGADIGWLMVKDARVLKSQRRDWQTYRRDFDLIREKNKHYVEILVTVGQRKHATSSTPLQSTFNKIDEDFELVNFKKGLNSLDLFKAMSFIFKQLDKVAFAFAKPNFDALEGRPVSGGIPGSGKRR
jgi:primosomal protein N'